MATSKPFLDFNESIIIGTDEAGRGCLAGPVYAAAVIFQSDRFVNEFRDSKMLSEERRDELFRCIQIEHRVGIGFATVQEITKFNILNAAMMAMTRSIENLRLTGDEKLDSRVLVDGNQLIRGFRYPQSAIVKGDQKVKEIAAASIAAKVMRDNELKKIHAIYPQYGFEKHKGYGTEAHRQAIKQYGPTEYHRPTFAGVREHLAQARP